MQEQHNNAETVVARILTKPGKLPKPLQADRDDRGRYKASEMLYTKALQRMKPKLSCEHIDPMETQECLRLVYVKQGEHRKAESIVEEMHRCMGKYAARNTQPSFRKSETDSTSRPCDQSLEWLTRKSYSSYTRKWSFPTGQGHRNQVASLVIYSICGIFICSMAWLAWYYQMIVESNDFRGDDFDIYQVRHNPHLQHNQPIEIHLPHTCQQSAGFLALRCKKC